MTIKHIAMVLEAGGLDGAEKLLLIAYCNRTDDHGYCWPGQQRLADDCGTSAATVKRVKKRLVEKKLIATKRRLDPRTGEPISNLTRVNIELLESMKRKGRDYDDNVIELLTFDADTPLPTKKKKTPRSPSEAPDQVMAQDEPDPVDNQDQAPDLLMAQDEPDPGLKMNPGSGQDEPEVVSNLSPAPGQDEPLTVSDPSVKPQRTVRPSVGSTELDFGDGTDGFGIDAGPVNKRGRQVAIRRTDGIDLLLGVGLMRPELVLTGEVLTDQGLMVDGLLSAGWPVELLVVVLSRPLPPDTRSVGAMMSHRLKELARTPVPRQLQMPAPRHSEGEYSGDAWQPYEDQKPSRVALGSSSPHHSAGTFHGAAAERWQDCDRCANPIFTPTGSDLCAVCLDWPLCPSCRKRCVPGARCEECGAVPSPMEFEVCEAHGDRFVKGTGCFQCSAP